MQDSPAYNHLGYTQDHPVNSEKHQNTLCITHNITYFFNKLLTKRSELKEIYSKNSTETNKRLNTTYAG